MQPDSKHFKIFKVLIWLTLAGCTLHFFDNVVFFDQYPEPAWLNAPIVAALWIPLALAAWRASSTVSGDYPDHVYTLIQGFVIGNWLSFGHYLFASPADVLPRINLIIAIQVTLATILFFYSLWMQLRFHRESMPYFTRIWAKLIAFYGVTIFTLEWFWPSDFQTWWL
ncbi:hypothetical protein [Alloalcanivorax profundimaris]|uniref:hypothetical protein n=1 Tax=Alloalcanivorax profundimaris TaxID=2735259 RepID=UPI001889039A|nr:hypothetical protein [Alloalcanivorax profundimaris]MBF1800859.1 hypothetical protein [Alloalcanivorax profundimaris]